MAVADLWKVWKGGCASACGREMSATPVSQGVDKYGDTFGVYLGFKKVWMSIETRAPGARCPVQVEHEADGKE